MFDLIEYRDTYLLWKFIVMLQRWSNDNLRNFGSCKSKIKTTGNIPAENTPTLFTRNCKIVVNAL